MCAPNTQVSCKAPSLAPALSASGCYPASPSFQVPWRAAVVLPFVCGIPLPPCDHRSRLNGPNTPLRLAEVSHHDVRTGPLEGTPSDPCSLMISRRALVEGRAVGLLDPECRLL